MKRERGIWVKTYYREYRDGNKRQPTGNVICVFSEEALPVASTGLSQHELWRQYECLTTETTLASKEPLINECSLVYLLERARTCSQEEAATIGPEMVDLIKRSEQHANEKQG